MKALRTLVIEDDAIIGGLLAETLEGLGHTVCALERNVANAVAAASHWRPDLMIVDADSAKRVALWRSKRSFEADLSRMCSSREIL
jgi:CheY-like chemotaxis protein